jgi:hypothetical protein
MTRFFVLFFFLLCGCSKYITPQQVLPPFVGDGPYIVYSSDGQATKIGFDKDMNMHTLRFNDRSSIGEITVWTQEGGYEFSLNLHETSIPPSRFDMPEQIIVISDPHGDFIPFIRFLKGAGVVNDQLEWSFGRGHLIVLGDVHNRGDDVTAIFWLIYKLEEQARKAGGAVHLMLGNHEVMVAQNDLRYTTPKYLTVAEKAGVDYNRLWNSQTELGRWINTRNQMAVFGDMLILHGGVSPQLAATGLSVEQVNDTVRKYIALERRATANSPVAALIMGSDGPLWYRGLIQPSENINDRVVSNLLEHFGVSRIIVGHTALPEISEFFDSRVICIKVNHRRNMDRSASRGILITPDEIWSIGCNGDRLDFAQP